MIVFLLIVFYVILKTVFLETKQDMYIILSGGDNYYKKYWKLYGAMMVATELVVLCFLASVYTGVLKALLLLPILGVVYSITHDCGMSYRLTGGFFHLGDSGWDAGVKKIFQHGVMWFIFKLVWLVILTGAYFNML